MNYFEKVLNTVSTAANGLTEFPYYEYQMKPKSTRMIIKTFLVPSERN
jgi:hypothetical protein